ncbi:hypothetical protein EJB05_08048 [Eragrostis curvula]|uniref:RING-type domain-containing protein n=1 Tax=Eragrostis curvula TaxID=38414 RepID=A0A5J9WI78_9POAL|nr:hypothetical protein EJB05_08048 [Eragrostis curvula]
MEGPDQSNPCAICLSGMGAGGGQAIFTAECSHTFHFRCIATNVAHGRLVCPLCNARWRELPFERSAQALPTVPHALRQQQPPLLPVHAVQPPPHPVAPEVFDDDEQVEPPPGRQSQQQAAAASMGTLVVNTYTEYPAIARASSRDDFAVLVHVKAPDGVGAAGDAPRAPLDLVTVLDVSGSMDGEKLVLLKQAMGFLIDNLGPNDRLSVVSFSSGARRVTKLLRMSDTGKETAMSGVESLVASGGTNIAEGLRMAAKSGRYESRVDEDGRSASVLVGELYADEERRFLLFLAVPAVEDDGETETTLIKTSCNYRDAASGTDVDVAAEDTVVMRPEQVVDAEPSMEVVRERIRVEAAEDIAVARAAAERGAFQEAVNILENRQRAVAESAAARGGDLMSRALGIELEEMRWRVATRETYEGSGRTVMLSGIQMHAQQRGNSTGSVTDSQLSRKLVHTNPPSRSPDMEGPDQSNPCAICLGGMGPGGGHAIFTAECSHTFHFQCISASVAHGHLVCPLCNAQWRELPSVPPTQPLTTVPPTLPQQPPPRGQPMHFVQPPLQPAQQEVFDDDEQVEPTFSHQSQRQAEAASRGSLIVKTHTEYSAIARESSHENFAVLVHVKAPSITEGEGAVSDAQRAPLDLVTVLDVSGSMSGEKIALLKQAMGFVIDNLGPNDRLSVVSFSSGARRVTRLLRMSDTGKGLARSGVESLVARGGTNIAEGLRMAAKVLDERRYRNAVSSVILLSDGQDNYTMRQRAHGPSPNYEALVPASFMGAGSGDRTAPIHTFGFGNDHDAAAMNVIAEATGGTFSFIENEAVIQDAFAQCIGGLLTVVMQEARISIACGHPGACVRSVKSGRYESRVDEGGRSASVRVGELYADEERRFLLFLDVPPPENDGEAETTLIKVSCSYRNAAGGMDVDVTAEDTVVARPEQVVDTERSMEVVRERLRVETAEDIAAARAAAERGAHQEAVDILENRQRAVAESEAALGGDRMSLALRIELEEMRGRVSTRESYAQSGRAFMLAGIQMHAQQRASSNRVRRSLRRTSTVLASSTAAMVQDGAPPPDGLSDEADETSSYATPAMRAMLLRSRMARVAPVHQQEQPTAGEDVGSSGGPKEATNQ